MPGGDPGIDDRFDALAHEQRRRLLLALLRENPQDAMGFVREPPPGATSRSPAGAAVGGDALEQEAIALHHVHLPKLEDHGFVAWDRETDQVTKGPAFDDLRPLLECLRDHSDELLGDRA